MSYFFEAKQYIHDFIHIVRGGRFPLLCIYINKLTTIRCLAALFVTQQIVYMYVKIIWNLKI